MALVSRTLIANHLHAPFISKDGKNSVVSGGQRVCVCEGKEDEIEKREAKWKERRATAPNTTAADSKLFVHDSLVSPGLQCPS